MLSNFRKFLFIIFQTISSEYFQTINSAFSKMKVYFFQTLKLIPKLQFFYFSNISQQCITLYLRKNGLKVNFLPSFFPTQNCFYENFCINQFHKMSNLLERTELELRSNSPRSSQIQDSLYKIAHFCCTFYYIFLPKLSSISYNFQTSDSVIF